MKNIFRAHREEIIPRSSATNHYYSSLANHQNLRLLKRFDMSIDIKTQQNALCLNSLLRWSSSQLNCIQEHMKKIDIIS